MAPELWTALAEPPEAADELEGGGFVQETGDGSALGLRASAEFVRRLAPWSLRRRAHALLAGHLARRPANLEQAARHAEAGGKPDEAGRLWLAAARRACRSHRHAAAARAFANALRLLPADTPEDELTEALADFGNCAARPLGDRVTS